MQITLTPKRGHSANPSCSGSIKRFSLKAVTHQVDVNPTVSAASGPKKLLLNTPKGLQATANKHVHSASACKEITVSAGISIFVIQKEKPKLGLIQKVIY